MKIRSVLFAGILFLGHPAFAQPCLPQGITFNTQAQIDSFPITNPNCSEIQGVVYITGSDITNLNGLSSIVSVGTDLYIRNTSALASLSGLNNLTHVGHEISIGNNALLTSLDGLGGLAFIGYAFELEYNPSLINLDGLNSLTSIGGYLKITDNSALMSLSGLNALSTIGGTLNISNNPLLHSLSGLENLTSTGDGLILSMNSSLTSLDSLSALTSIGGTLWIQDNHLLRGLAGLDNIDANSITDLTISDNDSLSTCEVLSVCKYLSSPNGNVVVQNNSAGCNDAAEIESACQAISTPEKVFPGSFIIFPNPADQMLFFPMDYLGKINQVNFYNKNGSGLYNIHPVSNRVDVSLLPTGFYIAEFISDTSIIRKKFEKK